MDQRASAGGTGNLPVPRGNLPRGRRKMLVPAGVWLSTFSALAIPPGW